MHNASWKWFFAYPVDLPVILSDYRIWLEPSNYRCVNVNAGVRTKGFSFLIPDNECTRYLDAINFRSQLVAYASP